jgi:NAD(P)-dependent dehydrogenase (short-subunit alcohol dehydrogenase family)
LAALAEAAAERGAEAAGADDAQLHPRDRIEGMGRSVNHASGGGNTNPFWLYTPSGMSPRARLVRGCADELLAIHWPILRLDFTEGYLTSIQILNASKIAIVTGGATGIGFETAAALASRGFAVVLASRDAGRTARAAARIGNARAVRLDLASQRSVRDAAAEIRATCDRLDLVINNAGVMEVPYARTEDGFELTFATNHLGHFALTGLLLDRLRATPGSRVVTVSSNAHRRAVPPFDETESERDYDPAGAYARSKLANLLFTYELQARLSAAGAGAIALAAHPGVVRTGLWRTSSALERALIRLPWLGHGARAGARPTLRAALDPAARGGDYFGPAGPLGHTGRPVRVESSPASHDAAARRRLWELSEALTGVAYP